MTPKEKAEELIGKCYDTFINDEDEHYTGTAWRLSKQCALIAVDEMYNIAHNLDDMATVGYLVDVKTEIEKL